jgi:hypothetical protein
MAIGKQLSDNNPSGTALGQSSSDLIGFYGVSPVSRYASSIAPAVSTASVSNGSTIWAFATSTQGDAVARMAYHVPLILSYLGLSTSS